MTYNIRHGRGNDEDAGPDLERTARVIRAAAPDVLALQEVDRLWARSGGVDQPAALAAMLGMDVRYGANLIGADGPGSGYGVAILSRYPVIRTSNMTLPVIDGWEPRGLLETRIAVPELGEIAVFNPHLQVGQRGRETEGQCQREAQSRVIAERIARADVPVILAGDFNAELDDLELSALRSRKLGLIDAWRVAGEGLAGATIPCHPDCEPANRIDAIFVTSQLSVTRAEVRVAGRPDGVRSLSGDCRH
jgi:endonuclease/exonuclease/phosphatase family metal-dependent hydrolase